MATNAPILVPIPPPRAVAPGESAVPIRVPIQTICRLNSHFYVTFPLDLEHFYLIHLDLLDRKSTKEEPDGRKMTWNITNAFLGRNIVTGFTRALPPKLDDLRVEFILSASHWDDEIPRHVQLLRVQPRQQKETTNTCKPLDVKSLRELVLFNMQTRGELDVFHAANKRYLTKRVEPTTSLGDHLVTKSCRSPMSTEVGGKAVMDAEERLVEMLCGVPIITCNQQRQTFNSATPITTPSLTRCASPTSTSSSASSIAHMWERVCTYGTARQYSTAERFDVEGLPSFIKHHGKRAMTLKRRHSFDDTVLSPRYRS